MVRPPAPPASPLLASGPSPAPGGGRPAAPPQSLCLCPRTSAVPVFSRRPSPCGTLAPGPQLRAPGAFASPLTLRLPPCPGCPIPSGGPAWVPDAPSVLGVQSEEPEGRSYSTLTTVREIETQTELLSPGSGRAEEEEDRDEGIKHAMNHFVQENGTLRAKPTGNGIYINGRGHLV